MKKEEFKSEITGTTYSYPYNGKQRYHYEFDLIVNGEEINSRTIKDLKNDDDLQKYLLAVKGENINPEGIKEWENQGIFIDKELKDLLKDIKSRKGPYRLEVYPIGDKLNYRVTEDFISELNKV